MLAQKLVGFSLAAAFIIAGIMYGGQLLSFFDVPSIFIVFGVLIGGTVASFPVNHIIAMTMAYFSQEPLTEDQALRAHFFFHSLANLALAGGITGCLIGLVNMLRNLDDPSHIGPAMAVALLTPLYGCLLGELFLRPAATECLSRTQTFPVNQRRGSSSLLFHVVILLLVLTSFFVMMLAFS